jgi:hypothetical protein
MAKRVARDRALAGVSSTTSLIYFLKKKDLNKTLSKLEKTTSNDAFLLYMKNITLKV